MCLTDGYWSIVLIPCSYLTDNLDPHPPERKVKRWRPFDGSDPNWSVNYNRVRFGLKPVDHWNVGFDYVDDCKSRFHTVIADELGSERFIGDLFLLTGLRC